MRTLFRVTVILVMLCACTLAVSAQESVEQTIDSLMTVYDAAPDDAAKLAICKDVLHKYPVSNYTVPLLGVAKDHSAALDKMDDFVQFAEEIRGLVTDAKMQKGIDRLLLEAYGEAKLLDKLNILADKLASGDEQNFNLYFDLMKAYAGVEQWDNVLAYSDRARPFATPEAYKNDYPDRKMDDEELQERARNREGMIYTYSGWAKARKGMLDKAFEDFEAADARTKRMYLGDTYGELDYFWGRTLALSGKLDQALDRLAAKAIFGEDEESQAAMREAYIKKHGSEDQYGAFIETQRIRLARRIDDFSLKGYSGEDLTLSSFAGKVIVLSFWFPT